MALKISVVMPSISNHNTPYAAGPRLTAWLRQLGHEVEQHDFGIELGLRMFSRAGLERLFAAINPATLTSEVESVYFDRDRYIRVIDPVIAFLQGKDMSLAYPIARGDFLPEGLHIQRESHANRRQAYGEWGTVDFARHLGTLLLRDLTLLFGQTISPHLQFDTYGESLMIARSSFEPVIGEVEREANLIEVMLQEIAEDLISEDTDLLCMTCPFPGQLLGALRLGKWAKRHRPKLQRALGGGYPSTELRRLEEPRVFDYVDFISLDDGELPLQQICERVSGKTVPLHQTFTRVDGKVVWSGKIDSELRFKDVPTPDYNGVDLRKYLNLVYGTNRVSRIQNEGPWLKLTAAHGCYWKKCTFCDVSLPYIAEFEPLSAAQIADQMDRMYEQTGWTGFHFTDEAAPPPLLVSLALELLRRGRAYRFWSNVRYDQGFTPDRCRVLAAAGMVAVTGGIEVASEGLLKKMSKGITIPQVTNVLKAFTDAGILTHAYLIYGFPGETKQDTINSLEIIRQMMSLKLLHSGFYHEFIATTHAPVGANPELYEIRIEGPKFQGFASYGTAHRHLNPSHQPSKVVMTKLQQIIIDYAGGKCLDRSVVGTLGSDYPEPTIQPGYIASHVNSDPSVYDAKTTRLCWLGGRPSWSRGLMSVSHASGTMRTQQSPRWLAEHLERCHPRGWNGKLPPKVEEFETTGWWEPLRSAGMVRI